MSQTQNKPVAMITGGSRGIGRATVLELFRRGCTVIFNYTSDTESAQEVVDLIQNAGGSAEMFQINVQDSQAVSHWVDDVKDKYGRVDILVNNAGITRDVLMAMMSLEDWQAVLDVNLTGAWNATRAVIRPMIRQKSGRIINVSSITALVGSAGQVNYSAAKAGLIGMTKALAREVASRGITINAVAPGFIDTDMFQTMSDQAKTAAIKQIPVGRLGKPEEVASLIAYLALGPTSYITGQVFVIDGGLAM